VKNLAGVLNPPKKIFFWQYQKKFSGKQVIAVFAEKLAKRKKSPLSGQLMTKAF
jgi:hypothetical protein